MATTLATKRQWRIQEGCHHPSQATCARLSSSLSSSLKSSPLSFSTSSLAHRHHDDHISGSLQTPSRADKLHLQCKHQSFAVNNWIISSKKQIWNQSITTLQCVQNDKKRSRFVLRIVIFVNWISDRCPTRPLCLQPRSSSSTNPGLFFQTPSSPLGCSSVRVSSKGNRRCHCHFCLENLQLGWFGNQTVVHGWL